MASMNAVTELVKGGLPGGIGFTMWFFMTNIAFAGNPEWPDGHQANNSR